MSDSALREVEREARLEAAPFAVLVAVALAVLSLVSLRADWRLLDGIGWWLWLAAAAPWAVLAVTLRTGLRRVPGRDMRQGIVRGLLVVVVAATLVQTGILVASLVSSDDLGISGPQLLQSGTTLWLSNVVAFGLAFWELDCGGPVERALSDRRHAPDFGFPQDDNPDLARPDWSPHLVNYLYLSTTNSIAFSPTDVMPLTRPAKALMTVESAVSVIAVLLIAARAINILQA